MAPRDRLPEIDLERHLRDAIGRVPRGRVVTCGSLALALGDRAAARWIGSWTLRHRHDADCPCHRIVRADGRLGGYPALFGGIAAKIERLTAEGIRLIGGKIDLARYAIEWEAIADTRPLAMLRNLQERLSQNLDFSHPSQTPQIVGGVDVSFRDPETAVAAFVLVAEKDSSLLDSLTITKPVRFPYITGYLAFREVPVLWEAVRAGLARGWRPDVICVDGSGRLHPGHLGSASHLGLICDLPTIGITKKLLCGKVDLDAPAPLEERPVVLDDEVVGTAVFPASGTSRPLFVSPGHKIDVGTASQIVRRQLGTGRRLPEPIYWADRLSRKAAKEA
ncbi:hypothetical protein JCM19992_08530 [Thermostilla marina]